MATYCPINTGGPLIWHDHIATQSQTVKGCGAMLDKFNAEGIRLHLESPTKVAVTAESMILVQHAVEMRGYECRL
jgi:hypothetical protein